MSTTKYRIALRAFLMLASLVAITDAAGQKPRLLDKETFMEMETISDPEIAPDSQRIVFTRGWIDQVKDESRSSIWMAEADGTRVREFTRGAWRDRAPAWAPDSKRVAFISDRSGTNQLHVMWVDTADVAQLTHLAGRAPGEPHWSPDGKQIAFTMRLPDEDPILEVKLPKKPKGAEWAKPAVIIDRLNWAADGRGQLEKGYTHVFVVDAALGGTPRQVTDGKYNHTDLEWSADGQTLYVSAIRKADAEYLDLDSEIYAVDLKTLSLKPLTDRKGLDASPTASPDGQWIAYTGYDDRNYTVHLHNLYVMDRNGGSKRLWIDALADSPKFITWAPDSSGVYYLVDERGSINVYFAPLRGAVRKVTEGVHTLNGFSLAANGQAATLRSTFHEARYLATFRVEEPLRMKKLVDVNADVLAGVKFANVEELWFTSKDGLRIQGWLVKPADFDANKKYPLVLRIHGGPWLMYDVGFSWESQNFAANGYAVLYTNPRGSRGYGQEFINGVQTSFPGKDFDDLMAGVDAAIAKGWVDVNNLFVFGGSAGGVLTAWIVGHTNRFAAAVSLYPVTNWHSFVGTTDDLTSWNRQFKKYPWEDPMEYALRSPLHYVSKVTTPTMIMTGEADLRTPISQSEEFYRALKVLKKETLLVRMPDEFHGWRRPSHLLLRQLYLLAWFDKHRRPSITSAP